MGIRLRVVREGRSLDVGRRGFGCHNREAKGFTMRVNSKQTALPIHDVILNALKGDTKNKFRFHRGHTQQLPKHKWLGLSTDCHVDQYKMRARHLFPCCRLKRSNDCQAVKSEMDSLCNSG